MTAAFDVIVIGGGLHGCSAALHLALRGRRVAVLERRYSGRHSSGINAGGVRSLGRALSEVALSVAGMEIWHHIRDLVDDDCGFVPCGHIKVAETAAELATLEQRADLLRGMGYVHEEIIGPDELFHLVPAIARHCLGAMITRDNGAADPFRTTMAFRRKAEALGVTVLQDNGVHGLERRGALWDVAADSGVFQAPVVVNCAGAWAGRIAAMVGDDIPLSTRASMMIVTERVAPFVTPVIGAQGRRLSFKQTAAGTVLIGGGHQGRADLDAERSEVRFDHLAHSADAATSLFPGLRDAVITRSWCGIEAQTPDQSPVIGPSPHAPGFFHSFGYSGHGFQLGPAAGRAICELIVDGSTNLGIAELSPARFIALS